MLIASIARYIAFKLLNLLGHFVSLCKMLVYHCLFCDTTSACKVVFNCAMSRDEQQMWKVIAGGTVVLAIVAALIIAVV